MHHQKAKVIKLLWAALGLSLAAGLQAEDALDLDEPEAGFFSRTFDRAETTRDNWSERWIDFAEGVDYYFSKENSPPEYKNESYVKLQLRETWEEHGEIQTDVRVKAKFDLPNTQRKAKVFFSSDEYTENSLEERVRSNSTGERFRRKESVSGIEITPDDEWNKWKRSARIGIKLRAPLVTFGRYRLRRPMEPWGEWLPEFTQEVWYFSDRGWGETSELEILRPINERFGLKYFTVLEFEDQNDYFENVHVLSLNQGLSDKSALEYRVGSVFSTEFRTQMTAYFFGSSYSYKLHEDWVFLTASPEVFFPKVDGWNAEASFTIKLDVYFSQ
ncbi:hypothetical protein [uncultured Zhongshania sp.]|uniref:hypothetical protein n=1 Tax=uncultured Zhongshania sp. TaxID=1642288 RepID=UPI0030D81604|tara:strand:- start:3283 stop:4272 length:990 start_codon:yes stop_codon:yes gene_type:complete